MSHREPAPQRAKSKSGPVLTCLANVEPRKVSWLWPGRLPLGRISLLVGRPGEGKSFLTSDAAARVSTGTPWPDGSECPRGSVLLLSGEDDAGDTIRPRLDAHNADVGRIHLLSAVRLVDSAGERERIVTLADVAPIESALQQLPDCRLIVVDPIGDYLGGGTDAHRDNEVRSILAPIAALAEKYGPAVLVVAHRRKAAATNADDTAMGSRAFTGLARCVWHLLRDGEDKNRRLLLPGKNNLAPGGTGLAFSIGGDPPCLNWERDPVEMTADDALAAENAGKRKPGPKAESHDKAAEWLASALANGPRLANELVAEWEHKGGAKRTMYRAKDSLKLDSFRPKVPGPSWWRLPKSAVVDAGSLQEKQPGNLGKQTKNKAFFPDLEGEECQDAKFSHLGNLGDDDKLFASDEWPEGFVTWEAAG